MESLPSRLVTLGAFGTLATLLAFPFAFRVLVLSVSLILVA